MPSPDSTHTPLGRTGLDARSARTMSMTEIAKLLGVTRSRVGQIEYRALAKIRRAIEREAREAGLSVHDWLYGE